jgi:hypothetical protein
VIFDIDHPVSAILFGTPVVSNCTSYYKTIEELFAMEIVLSVNTNDVSVDRARQMLPFCGVVHPALTPMSKPYHLSANSIFRVGGAVYVAYSDVSVNSERLIGSCGRGFYFHEDAFRRCMLLTGSGIESPDVVSTPETTTPESDEYRVALYAWIAANAPGGWIDELRKERDELLEKVDRLEWENKGIDEWRDEYVVVKQAKDDLLRVAEQALAALHTAKYYTSALPEYHISNTEVEKAIEVLEKAGVV